MAFAVERWSLTSIITLTSALILAVYTDSIVWFAFPFIHVFGFVGEQTRRD
jgi:hypothetical protein